MLLEAILRLRFCSNSVIDVVNWPLGLTFQAALDVNIDVSTNKSRIEAAYL